MMIRTFMVALALCLCAPALLAQAQDDEEAATDDGWGDDKADSGDSADEQGEGESEASADRAESAEPEASGEDAPEQEDGAAAAASEGERSWYFGPFARYVFVPSFMLKLFLAEAPTLGNGAVGIIADYRTESGPTLEIGMGYTGYGFEGPMQADGDPETDTEWIESDLALIHLTGSVLWDTDISEKFAFEYGVGLDLGVLIGDLVRTEAYKSGSGFAKCPMALPPPDPRAAYCEFPTNRPGSDAYDETGAHYNVVEERIPPIGGGFMLPHLALRYQPIPDLAIKLEAAYGIVQLWLGLSVAYAPNI